MASKSQKDKSKFCESCDKRFAYNKRLVEHLDKTSGCKEFYISKEITLPVTKAQTKGQSSKDLGEENVKNQEDEAMDNLSGQSEEPSDIEDSEKVSVWKVYEESNDHNTLGTPEPEEKTKRKSYSLEVKLEAIRRIDDVGVERMQVVALDLRLKLSLLKKWWENREKLAKIKSLKDKKAELNSSKVQEELGESLMDLDQAGSETTLEENSQSDAATRAPPAAGENSKSVEKKKRNKKVCGACSGCEAEDCGECKHCKDKPKFGGKNTIKQRCLARLCEVQEEQRKVARGAKGKSKRKSSNILSDDLSSSSANIPEDAETQNVGIVDSSMELNESSTEVTPAAVDDNETQEEVGGDDLNELRTALGSIGADYSQSWSQEQPPPVTSTVQKSVEGGQPLFPRMAAALELIPRPSQANHFPVVSSNHPSIAAPEAVVTIQRVEKKRKKRKEESSGQPRQAEVHNIHNILGQLSPVAPPELPSQWSSWTPGLTAQQQHFLQQGERAGGLPPQHQTPPLYNHPVPAPVTAPVPQYEPGPLSQPSIQQKFFSASSDEAWRSGYNSYQQQDGYTYNNGGAQVYPPPPPQFTQIQHQPQAAPNLEVPIKTEEPTISEETRVETVSITQDKLECLRIVSCKIVKNEMTQTQAAVETGLSEEMIRTWVGSLEDILETNKVAVEKANKYDALLVNYNKMKRAVWNLGKEFLSGTADDPVDLRL